MKCTNRNIFLFAVFGIVLCLGGCGEKESVPTNSYDTYETTRSVGISASAKAEDQLYFSENLCVIEDTELGTDTTTSSVAEGAGTFHLGTNSVVYAKNIYGKLYPASTTKILTAYMVLKYCEDLDATVTVSTNAANQAYDSSVCDLKAGDRISMRDLLYGLMLRSGNDAAIAIAEYMAGDVASFAQQMNQEASLLGASRSHFVNPNGLPDPDHYTCVYDLYLMMAEAVKNPLFVEIISAKSYDVNYIDAEGAIITKTWDNTNLYLTGQYHMPKGFELVGGKTGTTGDAGYCLVLYSKNPSGEPIISIVLKADGRSNLYMLMNQMLDGFAKES